MARPTTSAIGPRASDALRRAFTLVEVLIVIALIGAVTAVVVTDLSTLVDGAKSPTTYERVRDAIEAGRDAARDAGAPVRVVWAPDAGAIRIIADGDAHDFPVPDADGVSFVFTDATDGSEKPVDALEFHPSGAATPVIIAVAVHGVTSRYRMEMFSAALAPEKP